MMQFSIGPVQDFIAQARKTRDLWFGSHLLSQLGVAGAMEFQKLGGELIFPALDKQVTEEDAPNIHAPNKILGIIETDDPNRVAWKVRYAISGAWHSFANEAEGVIQESINPGTWKRQISDFVEFYAAWTIVDTTPYAEVLQNTEALLAARKTLRDFRQNDPGVMFGEVKSSLDGGRESVLLKKDKVMQNLASFGIKPRETLDAISLVKRLSKHIEVGKEKEFPSVCDIAFLPFHQSLRKNTKLRNIAQSYYGKVQNFGASRGKWREDNFNTDKYDARLFYERRIEDFLEENFISATQDSEAVVEELQQEITTAMYAMYESMKEAMNQDKGHFSEPTPYYAFLLADGDRMGDHLRKIEDMASHQAFSQALSEFSKGADGIITKHEGQLIYSGGDDVMAYLPVHQCLAAAVQLAESFTTTMSKVIASDTRKATLSVGIAIVHMLQPLEEVRQLAAEAEKKAKQDRNAMAVHIQKRSGADQMKVCIPLYQEATDALTELQLLIEKTYISSQCIYALRQLHRQYREMEKTSDWLKADAVDLLIQKEVERLVRKQQPNGDLKEPQDSSTTLTEREKQEKTKEIVIAILMKAYQRTGKPIDRLGQLADQLILLLHLQEMGGAYEKATEH
ncbi:type III-B CRISPR-associated protein Cas10/Cmr2 [Bacillus sp. FJAT-27264]|nr:type III-B CRISPR-associated protein Cas10/Cmr2 [Bacillus sp. FJAT-27264]